MCCFFSVTVVRKAASLSVSPFRHMPAHNLLSHVLLRCPRRWRTKHFAPYRILEPQGWIWRYKDAPSWTLPAYHQFLPTPFLFIVSLFVAWKCCTIMKKRTNNPFWSIVFYFSKSIYICIYCSGEGFSLWGCHARRHSFQNDGCGALFSCYYPWFWSIVH